MLFPRLRSTKNSGLCSLELGIAADYRTRRLCLTRSGCRPSCEPDHVLDLVWGNAEVTCDVRHRVAGLEAVDEILYASATVDDERETECDLRVDDYLGVAVGRQPYRIRPAVSPAVDALQLVLDDTRELALLGPDDD